MEASCLDTRSVGVRTVLHLSPSVMAAAVLSAQDSDVNLKQWLEGAVANRLANGNGDDAAPWSPQSADLFAQVASSAPEVLRGRWLLLYEHVLLERDLWHQAELTATEVEAGELPEAPYLLHARLRKAWPRLVATVFALC